MGGLRGSHPITSAERRVIGGGAEAPCGHGSRDVGSQSLSVNHPDLSRGGRRAAGNAEARRGFQPDSNPDPREGASSGVLCGEIPRDIVLSHSSRMIPRTLQAELRGLTTGKPR